MNFRNKHIKQLSKKAIRSFFKISIVLAVMFISTNLFAQVINNNGAVISVTGGTFVQGDTLENTAGTITNNGTIGLRGHYINIGTTTGNGIYNLEGNWTNTGIFNPGTSNVNFIGNNNQTITSTGGEIFYNLKINNSGTSFISNRILLINNVNVSNTLTIADGNIETGANILNLTNQASSSLDYTSTDSSRIVGKFERGVSAPTNYLFPIGSEDNYNPLNIDLNAIQNAGSVLSEFVASDPDSIGLPLPDEGYLNPADSVEVYDADSLGYWSLTANNGFASNDFNVNLDGAGFKSPYQNITRIIKRPAGGDWTLDGTHKDGNGSIIFRDNLGGGISTLGHHFGYGWCRPRIQTQPADTAICDGESATFSIVATGRGTLTYSWEVLELSGGWQPISDNTIYDNSDTDTLLIIAADTSMNGYKYRVTVRDSLGNFHRSNAQATLTVNPRPEVLATPQQDTICNGETTHIVLTSTEPGTTYWLEILNPLNNIVGDDMILDGDTIKDVLTNPTLSADSVVYRIVPYGQFSTQCEGPADTVVIWVEPTVTISAVNDTICDNTPTLIDVSSLNTTTNGIRYTWVVTPNGAINGETDSDAVGQNIGSDIIQTLDNTSLVAQMVTYTITPWTIDASGNNKCSGTPINIDIWVEPTVEINAANDTICDGDFTNILVTSPNTTTNGIRYTWTVTENAEIENEASSIGNGQIIGTPISQNLVNTSFVKQLVQYEITPWTVNASDNNECSDAGEVITIDIWVDPTPRVFASVTRDTICNDTYNEITLTTPNILTTGVVTFDYNSVADAGLTGSSNRINQLNGFVITDSLHNATAFPAKPLVVRYNITPRALSIGCADGPGIVDSVTVHPTPDITFPTVDSVRCYLESNGLVIIRAKNTINQFTYQWDDDLNQTDTIADGLIERLYNVTVTDNQGCTKDTSVFIGQPDELFANVDSLSDVSCFGNDDGYARVIPIGGNGQFTYEWDNGSILNYIANIDGGYYSVTVTDHKLCMVDTTVTIIEPGIETASLNSSNVVCHGENNGSIEILSPIGTYSWSNGETTRIINNLKPDRYSVEIIYNGACIANGEVEITEPDSLELEYTSNNISCAGDADGSINLTISGGNNYNPDPYTFNWSTLDGIGLVDGQEDQYGLSGGTYYINILDERFCEINDTIIVGEPPTFLTNTTYNDITCFGDNDGSINLDVQGGNGNYSYLWSNGETDANLTSLSEGQYIVTITDQKFCEIYDTVDIMEPDLLVADITSTNVSCFGYDDGTAVVDINGGIGNYDILWNTSETVDSIYGLSQGSYSVIVNDDNNCVTSNEIEITEPEAIENNLTFENITCFGFNNGQIALIPTGGTIPYNYIWSHDPGYLNSNANDLLPGDYTISVVDDNNCMETSSVTLTQPEELTATIYEEEISCFGFNDGLISITMTGGTPDYVYDWSNDYNDPIQDLMGPGVYNIRISDQLDCFIDTTIELIEPQELRINPLIRRPTCSDIQDGYIELNITGGRTNNGTYDIIWENGPVTFEENLYEIRSGIYDVTIYDSSQCIIDTTFTVRSINDFCIDIPTAFTPNGDTFNEKWEIDMGGLYPNVEIEVFDRTGRKVFYSKGYEESQYWDGSYNGKELPMDAYYYIINLKNGASRISGVVTIVR